MGGVRLYGVPSFPAILAGTASWARSIEASLRFGDARSESLSKASGASFLRRLVGRITCDWKDFKVPRQSPVLPVQPFLPAGDKSLSHIQFDNGRCHGSTFVTVIKVDGWWGPPDKAIVQGTLQGVREVKPSPPMSFLAR